MLITGCSNSLLTKFQDKQCISNCSAPPSEQKMFDQPVLQTIQMFIAELGVGLVVLYTFLLNKYRSNELSFPIIKKSVLRLFKRDSNKGYTALDSSEDSLASDRSGLLDSVSRNSNDNSNGSASASSSATQISASEAGISSPKQDGSNSHRKYSEEETDDLVVADTDSKRTKLEGKKVLLLAIPACCDLMGTTLMNVGLLLTPVSVFQMVRGAIVLFVGFFSVIFLKRTLLKKQWIGLLAVFGGVFVVGLSAMTSSDPSPESVKPDPAAALQETIGIGMILLAQVFSATQFVVEEFILERYAMSPFNVVMWEGFFGTSLTLSGSLVIANLFISKEKLPDSMFNLNQGLNEMIGNKAVWVSSIVIMFMMSTFNVTGMTVTRLISATSRSTIDTSRTVGIWLVSMIIGWESFRFLQLCGFVLLVYGTLLFNGIIGNDKEVKENVEELLPHEFEHT